MQPPSPSEPNQSAAGAPNAQPALAGAGVTVPVPMPPAATKAAATDDLPPIADDGDLIEKDWVIKVKQVLGASAGNPYEQNKQLARLRADYLQKRYGKDVKVDS